MKIFLLILSLLFISSYINCTKSKQNVASNKKPDITVNKSVEKWEKIKAEVDEIENSENPYQLGQEYAEKDIDNGQFIIVTVGDPKKEVFEWESVLKEKYGIKMKHFGCCYSDKVEKYAEGYNKISESKMKEIFGRYVLDDTRKEADKIIEKKISNASNL